MSLVPTSIPWPTLRSLDARIEQLGLDLDRARTSLDNLPIGVVLVDAHGVEALRNARSHQSTGHGEVLVQEAVDRHVQLALAWSSSRARRSSCSVRRVESFR